MHDLPNTFVRGLLPIESGFVWVQPKITDCNLTSATIDRRDFLAVKRRAENEVLIPPCPKIAFSGRECVDHKLIWAKPFDVPPG